MMKEGNNIVKECIVVLLKYEKGSINLKEAVNEFCAVSGVSRDTATSFIKSLNRSNVVQLSK